MSEKTNKRRRQVPIESLNLSGNSNSNKTAEVDAFDNKQPNFLKRLSASQKLLACGIIALLSLGVFGAGMKYLEDSAKQQKAVSANGLGKQTDAGLLAKVNPFVEPPPPTSTPQLSKEYIYAGSRMLAVEDANANAAPPADLAVWRPGTGYWYVLGGVTGSQQIAYAWGGTGDKPVPGDYDGDGKTDFSVFRTSNGTWYINNSSNGNTTELAYGLGNDVPAQADFDGDGRIDMAVFRPSDGYWHITKSSSQTSFSTQFGLGTDIPAPADYDGDGKADIAVWRGSNQTFYVLRSSDNQLQSQLLGSSSSDIPVSADYDGDGKADFAVKIGNVWNIKQSSNNQLIQISWQAAGDKVVQNDYDGDGKVDIAVWNASSGNWHIRNSSTGQTRTTQWGGTINGTQDIPVPAFYRR